MIWYAAMACAKFVEQIELMKIWIQIHFYTLITCAKMFVKWSPDKCKQNIMAAHYEKSVFISVWQSSGDVVQCLYKHCHSEVGKAEGK